MRSSQLGPALLEALREALLRLGVEAIGVELAAAAQALDRDRQGDLGHQRHDDRAERLGGRAGQTLAGHEFLLGVDSLQSTVYSADRCSLCAFAPRRRSATSGAAGSRRRGRRPRASRRTAACRTRAAASRSASRPAAIPAKRRAVASLGLVDPAAGKRFLIDATPDFARADRARSAACPTAILLTHAHIGHYLGLAQLGREVLGARRVPVYCTPSMAKFLRENKPWSRLVALENIAIREVEPGREFALTDRPARDAIRVPHRDEDSDTVACLVRGPDALGPLAARHRQVGEVGPDASRTSRAIRRSRRSSTGRSSPPTRSPAARSRRSRTRSFPRRRRSSRAGSPQARRVFLVHLNHTNRLLWDEEAPSRRSRSEGSASPTEGQRIRGSRRLRGSGSKIDLAMSAPDPEPASRPSLARHDRAPPQRVARGLLAQGRLARAAPALSGLRQGQALPDLLRDARELLLLRRAASRASTDSGSARSTSTRSSSPSV